MAAKLRAVGADEKPKAPPATLAEATTSSRIEFLERARLMIAQQIDAGVPPHALGRLIDTAERLDMEVRRLSVLETEGGGVAQSEDGEFNAAAI